MKKSLKIWKSLLIAGVIVGVSSVVNAAIATSGATMTGDIVGKIECSEMPNESTVIWEYHHMFIYIPGISHIALTDDEGNFRISYVQAGTYELGVDGSHHSIETVATDIKVRAFRVTDIGTVQVECEYGGD